LVTANGSVLTINNEDNPDLFWAIRGAGSNFGVCTQFVLQLHTQRRNVFAGIVLYPPPVLGQALSVIDKWWAEGPSEKEAAMQLIARGPDGNVCVLQCQPNIFLITFHCSHS
jgi:hypothetical protein